MEFKERLKRFAKVNGLDETEVLETAIRLLRQVEEVKEGRG